MQYICYNLGMNKNRIEYSIEYPTEYSIEYSIGYSIEYSIGTLKCHMENLT